MFYWLLQKATDKQKAMLGEVLVWVTLVGWPLSALTIAKDEPQFVLGLSWVAIFLTGVNILIDLDTHEKVVNSE